MQLLGSNVLDDFKRPSILGSSVLDAWPLTRAVQDTMQVPHTHDRPITQVFFKIMFHLIKLLNYVLSELRYMR